MKEEEEPGPMTATPQLLERVRFFVQRFFFFFEQRFFVRPFNS